MSKDSSHTYIHLASSRIADLFEEFTRPPLLPEEIFISPQHQPPNPEDEDDVVPDQHAAFGIQRATQSRREPMWRDLNLGDLLPGEDGTEEPAEGAPAGQALVARGVAAGGLRRAERSGVGRGGGIGVSGVEGAGVGLRVLPR